MKKNIFSLLFLLSAVPAFVFAGVGSDGLDFLKIKPSARAASLKDGFVAVADDASAAFYNPAGLFQANSAEISFMHMAYSMDIGYEFGTVVLPLNDKFTIGAYAVYLNYGDIDRTTEDSFGIYNGTNGAFAPSNLAFALSGSLKLDDNTGVGVNIKYASESIDTTNLSALLADAGFLTSIDSMKIGAAVYNISGNIGQDKAPMYARLGASSKFKALKEDDLLVACGVDYEFAGTKLMGSIGAEYTYEDFLALRAGYGLGYDAESIDIGVGFKTEIMGLVSKIDYDFSLLGELNIAHRISLSVAFDDGYRKSGTKKSTSVAPVKAGKQNTIKYYFKKK